MVGTALFYRAAETYRGNFDQATSKFLARPYTGDEFCARSPSFSLLFSLVSSYNLDLSTDQLAQKVP